MFVRICPYLICRCKGGTPPLAHKAARLGVDRGDVRRAGERHPSKMARKLAMRSSFIWAKKRGE